MRRQSEQVIVWLCFVDVELAYVRSVASCYLKRYHHRAHRGASRYTEKKRVTISQGSCPFLLGGEAITFHTIIKNYVFNKIILKAGLNSS